MSATEALHLVFVFLSGLAMGSLVALMLGHLMDEHWLAPVRAELEAAALTPPLLILFGIPLAFGLDQLFPWMSQRTDLPPLRAEFLSPGFYLVRSAFYLFACAGLAFWLVCARQVRKVSAIGLALMTPIMSFAAYDWVLSRDPHWWSTLFGFAYGLNQALAALACAILVTLLGAEHASPTRMKSLERALLTLALLTAWTWFSQFVIVWLANLPAGAGWYLERSDPQNLQLLTVSYLLMLIAIVVLVPSGVSRLGMIVGSALALLYHGTHMVWILQPRGQLSWPALAVILGAMASWIAAYAVAMRLLPTYAEEALAEPE